MTLQTTFLIILSVLGILVTLYLISSRVKKKPLVCMIGDDCNKVVESKYSKIFYINNDILGLGYYLPVLVSALYLIYISKNILLPMQIISGISVLTSIFLFFIQLRIIKKYCFYCNVSNLINLFIFLVFLML